MSAALEEFTSGNAVPMPVKVIGLMPMYCVVRVVAAVFAQSNEMDVTVCENPMVTSPFAEVFALPAVPVKTAVAPVPARAFVVPAVRVVA